MIRTIRDIPIYYDICGEGRPIVMIHGFTPDHRLMLGCMEPVFRDLPGWQRIYFDLPGMGQTPGPTWLDNTGQMLELVHEFIQDLLPGQSYCLVGESYGGYLAQGLVAKDPAPVEGLFLLCPLIVADEATRRLPQHTVLEQDPGLREQLTPQEWAEFASIAVIQTHETWQKMKADVVCGLQAADRAFLDRLYHNGYGYDLPPAPGEFVFDRPVLILAGRQDSIVGYEDAWQWLETYPHATYAVLDHAGHNLQIEQPALFAALTIEWLRRVEKRVV